MPRCPVCKKPLTPEEYERALGIWKEKKQHLHKIESKLSAQRAALQQKQADYRRQQAALVSERKSLRRKLRAEMEKTKQKEVTERVQAERARTQRLTEGMRSRMRVLQDRIRQLRRGKTPQTEGFDDEKKLEAALIGAFAGDRIKRVGKKGDILHWIRRGGRQIGLIVYECKREPRISDRHIDQTHKAKNQREANFAVLVSAGKRKGFGGLRIERDVIIVAPAGVLSLSSLLRMHLLEMDRRRLPKSQQALVAQRLMEYLRSPLYRNPIRDIVTRTRRLEQMVQEEVETHARTWDRRLEQYHEMAWDSRSVQHTVQLLLEGKKPEPLAHPKPKPLALLPSGQ